MEEEAQEKFPLLYNVSISKHAETVYSSIHDSTKINKIKSFSHHTILALCELKYTRIHIQTDRNVKLLTHLYFDSSCLKLESFASQLFLTENSFFYFFSFVCLEGSVKNKVRKEVNFFHHYISHKEGRSGRMKFFVKLLVLLTHFLILHF